MFGLKDNHLNLIKSVFEGHTNVSKVVIYGSRAKGNYRAGSDIDLTLFGENLNFNTLLKIENELDDLLLPYHIDLSIFNNIENNDLIEHINRVGIVFYEKPQ
jgi:predicted nucleotidyltransferase